MRSRVALMLLLVACRSQPTPTPPVDGASVDASVEIPKITGTLRELTMLANGHVFLTTSNNDSWLWDWDATKPGAAPNKTALSTSNELAFLSPGPSLIVQREGSTTRTLELWDLATHTKIRTLEGEFPRFQTLPSFSADGTRFLFYVCHRAPNIDSNLLCDAGIFALPTGDLVRRMTFTFPYAGRIHSPVLRLSKDGRYFDMTLHEFPAVIFEVATGKVVFPTDGKVPSPSSPELTLLSLDGSAAVTATERRLAVTDLSTGKERSHIDLDLRGSLTSRASPDGKHVASLVIKHDPKRPKSVHRAEVAVWTVGTDKLDVRPIPLGECAFCKIEWAGNADLLIQADSYDHRPPVRLRLNVDPAVASAGPPEALPTFEGGSFRVFFDGAKSVEEVGDGGPSLDVILTPSGRRLELPPLYRPGYRAYEPRVVGDRLLLGSPKLVRVIDRGGAVSELAIVSPP